MNHILNYDYIFLVIFIVLSLIEFTESSIRINLFAESKSMNRSLLLISLLLVFTGFKQSESFTAVWQKLQQLMKIHPRAKFDKNKCAIRPKKLATFCRP